MKKFVTSAVLSAILVFFVSVGSAFAGFLGSPLSGYGPYTTPITAVMDHDSRWNYIESYTGETGSYWDGCLAYVNGQNVVCAEWNEPYPWAYKKSGGGDWSIMFNYDDDASGSGYQYLWYDNHTGYDYGVLQWTPVLAAASGYVTYYDSTWGQIKIDHGNGYRTAYTHMTNIVPNYCPQYVTKGSVIGYVSNVAPISVGYHLHFEVEKNVSGSWVEVDPYGGSGQPVLWE